MPDWSSYKLSDLILFSARTYYRQLELYNQTIWPLHLVSLLFALFICYLIWRKPAWSGRAITVILIICWSWVAWAYLYQRLATIHWVASWYSIAFGLQVLLLIWHGLIQDKLNITASKRAVYSGSIIFSFAVIALPVIQGAISGKWAQAELFGLAPDPTVLASMGLILLTRYRVWILLVMPMLWCVITGATLWVLKSPISFVLPAFAVLALLLNRRHFKNSNIHY